MVLTKEYRICMPLSVEEYQIGQLYMIARHSHEQAEAGEGVEVVENVPCEDDEYGKGQYTEKRIYLSSRLPYWIQALIPKVFYVTEKAWNYYPFTITEYTCSFLPKLSVHIKTKYENNNGSSDNSLNLSVEELEERVVEHVDIAYDEVSPKHYKAEEDVKFYQSQKTGRGPLMEGWRDDSNPIMCSYKLVKVSFEVWGLQTKVEDLVQQSVREILLLGHRQAFAWIDEWYGMTLEDVRKYEKKMQEETNTKVVGHSKDDQLEDECSKGDTALGTGEKEEKPVESVPVLLSEKIPKSTESPETPKTPATPKSPKSWFAWS